jgi:hypothetical protein
MQIICHFLCLILQCFACNINYINSGVFMEEYKQIMSDGMFYALISVQVVSIISVAAMLVWAVLQ